MPGRIGWQKSAKDRPKRMQPYNDVIADQTIFEILDGIRIISKILKSMTSSQDKNSCQSFFFKRKSFFFYVQVSERKFLFVAAAVVAALCPIFFLHRRISIFRRNFLGVVRIGRRERTFGAMRQGTSQRS